MKYIAYHKMIHDSKNEEQVIHSIRTYCEKKEIPLYKDKVYTERIARAKGTQIVYPFLKEDLLEPGDAFLIAKIHSLGKNKEEIWRELQFFVKSKIRLMVMEVPVSMELPEGIPWDIYADVMNQTMEQMYHLIVENERKEDQKKEHSGRPRVIHFSDFAQEYRRVMRGEIRPFDLRDQLGMTTPTFYKYRGIYKEMVSTQVKQLVQLLQIYGIKLTEEEVKQIQRIVSGEQEDNGTLQNLIKEIDVMSHENIETNKVEKEVAEVKATMEMEGFQLTEEDLERSRKIISGEIDGKEEIKKIIEKYRQN